MKRALLTLIFILIPSLCFSATGDTETVMGKTDTTISTIIGKAGTGIATIMGKNYTDGDGGGEVAGRTIGAWDPDGVNIGAWESDTQ